MKEWRSECLTFLKAGAERIEENMIEERGFYRLDGRETEVGGSGRKELRTELLEQLKEEEKVQRQEEYEQRLAQAVDEVSALVAEKGTPAVHEQVEKILDSVQNMAFQEGYHYAIAVLEDCLIK